MADGARSDAHLLLDPRVVADAGRTRLVVGKVEKDPHGALFIEDRPWEVRFDNLYANVLFDEEAGRYRCWYNPFIVDEVTATTPPARRVGAYRPGRREMGVCYATSSDGIAWEKPALGIVEFDGSTANNLVLRHCHGTGVVEDCHDPNPARRFKAFMQDGTAASPDGLHWSPLEPHPEIAAKGDTHNYAFWDEQAGLYVGITRLWRDGQRLVARTESADFRRWTRAVEIIRALPTEPHRQPYALLPFRYGGLYLGLLMLIDTEADTVDCDLAWSRDTAHWERLCPGTPLIPRGPVGSFDSGCIYGAASPLVRDGQVRLYYGGGDAPHGGWRRTGLGLARMRLDGFAGLEPAPGEDSATVVTQPVTCLGPRLRVSADAAGGSIRATVLGVDGLRLTDCIPIEDDVSDHAVMWTNRADLRALIGRPLQLEFELRSARLYAFRLAD
jgi:hypothetical protein